MRYRPRGPRKKRDRVRPTQEEITESLADIVPSLDRLMDDLQAGRPKVEDLPF